MTVQAGDGGGRFTPDRLRKNLKKLEKWARREGIECCQLVAMPTRRNIIGGRPLRRLAVIQEWRAAETVDAQKARQRLFDIIAATLSVLGIPPNKLVLKPVERQQKAKTVVSENELIKASSRRSANIMRAMGTRRIISTPVCSSITVLPAECWGEMSKGKDFESSFLYRQRQRITRGFGGARSNQ